MNGSPGRGEGGAGEGGGGGWRTSSHRTSLASDELRSGSLTFSFSSSPDTMDTRGCTPPLHITNPSILTRCLFEGPPHVSLFSSLSGGSNNRHGGSNNAAQQLC